MTSFTVHLPPTAPGERPAAEKIVFLRDGFSTWAFVFGPLWFMWKRAWLPALLWALVLAAVAGAGALLKIPVDAMSFAGLAVSLFLGFEGGRILAWSLHRRGFVESDVVIGENEEEAEVVYFERLRAREVRGPVERGA
ncbi:MAG: DUF2628 domain-containing protein [Methylocystis sp.]|uniref:DUF2628 domain-containing protein n=1 Tax=Methylocystis sp. TaxID=1911079 RepID=UPI003DA4F5C4